MADTAMIPWSPEVLEGAQPVQPAQAFSPLTDVAQAIPQIKAKQAELQRARDAEQATLAASAAADGAADHRAAIARSDALPRAHRRGARRDEHREAPARDRPARHRDQRV